MEFSETCWLHPSTYLGSTTQSHQEDIAVTRKKRKMQAGKKRSNTRSEGVQSLETTKKSIKNQEKLLKFEFRQMLPLDCCLINTIHVFLLTYLIEFICSDILGFNVLRTCSQIKGFWPGICKFASDHYSCKTLILKPSDLNFLFTWWVGWENIKVPSIIFKMDRTLLAWWQPAPLNNNK